MLTPDHATVRSRARDNFGVDYFIHRSALVAQFYAHDASRPCSPLLLDPRPHSSPLLLDQSPDNTCSNGPLDKLG